MLAAITPSLHGCGLIEQAAISTPPLVWIATCIKRILSAMEKKVVRLILTYHEIAMSVVGFHLIDVMNYRFGRQAMTDSFLSYGHVLKAITSNHIA